MIERGKFDFVNAKASDAAATVTDLSAADDPRWAGVIVLRAGESFALSPRSRHDLYVLDGSVGTDGAADPWEQGAFVTRCGGEVLQAREQGAVVFVYTDRSARDCSETAQPAASRNWRNARAAGMRVAPLSSAGHSLSLVEWEPGARTREHDHRHGEEIFVLSGELRSYEERYPAGTWLRLHPGSQHQPFAEIPTVILLRNGHLDAAQQPVLT